MNAEQWWQNLKPCLRERKTQRSDLDNVGLCQVVCSVNLCSPNKKAKQTFILGFSLGQ